MEPDVNIGQNGASAEQTLEEHSSATGTDIPMFSQNSFNSFNQAAAKQLHIGFGYVSTLSRDSAAYPTHTV